MGTDTASQTPQRTASEQLPVSFEKRMSPD